MTRPSFLARPLRRYSSCDCLQTRAVDVDAPIVRKGLRHRHFIHGQAPASPARRRAMSWRVTEESTMSTGHYEFVGGYPTPETVQKAYDDADYCRAVQAYKFFYPSVAFTAGYRSLTALGIEANRHVGMMSGSPRQLVFTPNSDTPYAFVPLDLSAGPIVIEMPPGPIMGAINDLNQQWVMDYGVPGPDAGKGGKHLLLPPGHDTDVPPGYYVGRPTTIRVTALLRALPVHGDNAAANALMKTVRFRRLDAPQAFETQWIDISERAADFTPVSIEKGLAFWTALHELIDEEPVNEQYRTYYGELAALGIVKGAPFKPDARMTDILERAAHDANAQMRVQSFADRRPDRIAWPDRRWEWATLRPENGTFDLPGYRDLEAREKWFYQAMVESPAMFQRKAGGGSLYWLGLRDATGAYLDGGSTYTLSVPQPVPGQLFWSVTVYDNETRSEIQTDQGYAALRSMFELEDAAKSTDVVLRFGPTQPATDTARWIKTIPGKGWFVYFRIYGPEPAAFDGSWKPGDFEKV
jgi:hypothetical protein